jgi:hypothetical protein
VIGRNTAFTYKGKAVDLKQIGRELNVRYVLEGSVQRGGNRMRVNVQLIDAETGNHLWAERFEKPLADLFEMQDEIVARLAGTLNAQLVAAEARRAERAPTPNSMDLYFQGEAYFNRGMSPANLAQARDFFDRAMSADPDNVDARVESVRVDVSEAMQFFVSDPSATLAVAEAKVTATLSLVPDHARGHLMLGIIYMLTKRPSGSIAELSNISTRAKLPRRRSQRCAKISKARAVCPNRSLKKCAPRMFEPWLPEAFGGPALHPLDFLPIIEELSGADGSAGWCATIGSVHSLLAGSLNEAAAREILANQAIVAGTVNPTGKAVVVDDGYRASGRWDYRQRHHVLRMDARQLHRA